ncbi:pilin isopeptide linkage domain-containing protein [Eubacterium ruminantium]|nr:pilin isopeptide linkage domain-containing protein [Eubacterium ruminantium]
MIYKNQLHISKLNFARIITAGMILTVMLACGFCCVLRSVAAEGAYKPLEIEINFECIENLKLPAGSYNIEISPGKEEFPVPDKNVVRINDGAGSFNLTILEPGDYTYLVFQQKGSDEDVIYDDTVYEIHITVMNKNTEEDTQAVEDGREELIYYMSVNYAGTDKKPEYIEFVNESAGVGTETTETTTESSTDGSSEGSSDGVKTGDSTDIGFLMSVMGISAAAVFILIFLKISSDKKRAEEEE